MISRPSFQRPVRRTQETSRVRVAVLSAPDRRTPLRAAGTALFGIALATGQVGWAAVGVAAFALSAGG